MQNNKHRKKMAAPIVITVLFLLYLVFYGIAVFFLIDLSPYMVLLAIPLVALGVGMIYVLRERIKEIRSGEEDDLSDY